MNLRPDARQPLQESTTYARPAEKCAQELSKSGVTICSFSSLYSREPSARSYKETVSFLGAQRSLRRGQWANKARQAQRERQARLDWNHFDGGSRGNRGKGPPILAGKSLRQCPSAPPESATFSPVFPRGCPCRCGVVVDSARTRLPPLRQQVPLRHHRAQQCLVAVRSHTIQRKQVHAVDPSPSDPPPQH